MHTNFQRSKVRIDALAYPLIIILFSAVALFSIWSNRFLPLQDYPQHLFIAFATSTANNPAFNWQQYYNIDPGFGPYSLCYLFIGALAKTLPIEVAGKAFISLILGLYATFALTQHKTKEGNTPWSLILLFPVFFNQIFYFGFLNYLLALPILLFALRETERVAKVPFSSRGLLYLFLLLSLVFLSHPFALVIYLFFGGWFLLFSLPDRLAFKRLFITLFITGLLFVAWYIQLPSPDGPSSFTWVPPIEGSLPFILLLFTGMKFNNGIEPTTVLLWLIIVATLTVGAYKVRAQFRLNRLHMALTVSALILFFILPFHFGYYAVFNFRLAPVVYILALVLISVVPLPRVNVAVLTVASLALLIIANQRHKEFSDETASIVPVLEKMSANARIFPIYNDSRSVVFDPGFFYLIHNHDHFYYHTMVGGGVSPSLFANSMMPVQFKPGMRPPASAATLPVLLQSYDYILIRKPLAEDIKSLAVHMTLVEQTADWVAFANPDAGQ